jgi:rhodanese-related sulfurtransferase
MFSPGGKPIMDRFLRQNSGDGLEKSIEATILARPEQDLENKAMVEVVTREELKKGLADGTVVLIDVREPNEYAAGHIPGAASLPLSRFDPARLPKEPGKRVILNCRSGHRTLQALEMARLGGRRDVCAHYAGSMLDWIAAGEPVEV